MQYSNPLQPEPWRTASSELADWALAHLVNRTDARGGYYAKDGEVRRTTRKATDRRWQPHDVALKGHFSATRPEHIVGFHSTSPNNTCRWLGIDIDAHRGEDPIENLRIAIEICSRLAEYGLAGHIFNSDGRGGIHILVLFDKPIATTIVFALGQRVVKGFAVETYPRQPEIAASGFGNWLRLPGRHHTRDHWTRYWSGESWLDAKGTVNAILAIEPCAFPELPPLVRVGQSRSRRLFKNRRGTSFTDSPDSLRAWLEAHGVSVKETRLPDKDTAILVLNGCPFFDDHGEGDGDTSVAVTWRATGVGFRCFHNRCANFRWRDLRAKLDPRRSKRRKRQHQIQSSKPAAARRGTATHATGATCRTRAIRIGCDTEIRSQS